MNPVVFRHQTNIISHRGCTPRISSGNITRTWCAAFRVCSVVRTNPWMSGWIKLHRQIRENPIYRNSTALHLWIECLMRAAHDEHTVLLKRQRLTLTSGSFVFGYRELATVSNCSVSTVKFWMDYFEAERMIERTTTPKGTICKLKNWSDYQSTEHFSERQANAERTLSEPNKNVKNEKNHKKSYAVRPETESAYELIDELCTKYGLTNDVNMNALDIQVCRHVSTIRIRVELQRYITWMIQKGRDRVTASGVAGWFEKAKEIQKREQLRQLERKEAEINPAAAKRRKELKDKQEGFSQEQSIADFTAAAS